MILLCSITWIDYLQAIASISAIALLIPTFIQLGLTIKQLRVTQGTTEIQNTLNALSWFDEKEITQLLNRISEENGLTVHVENEDVIIRLLYYLDTVCTMLKLNQLNKFLIIQMNDDFQQIKRNQKVQQVYEQNKELYKNLDFDLLVNSTQV